MKKLPMFARKIIYKGVKAYIEALPIKSHITCHILADRYCSFKPNADINGITPDHIYNLFPEFAEQKPKRKKIGDLWWALGKNGNKSRIKALQRAIDLCDKK